MLPPTLSREATRRLPYSRRSRVLVLLVGIAVSSCNSFAGDLGPAPSGNFEELTPLEIKNDQPVLRTGEVAFSGVPIPRDLNLTSIDGLVLVGAGDRLRVAQFDVLSRWGGPRDDTSLPIRWLQVSVPADVGPSDVTTYSLRKYDSLQMVDDPFAVHLRIQGEEYVIDTGLATFTLDPANPALFKSIAFDEDDDGAGRVAVYGHTPGAGPMLIFDDGGTDVRLDTSVPGQVVVDPGGFSVEENGPVKAVVALRGHFSDPDGRSLCYSGDSPYERFGYTAVATFCRASRDFTLQVNIRNECSDAFSGPWTDDAATVVRASWEFPFSSSSPTRSYYSGSGAMYASPPGFAGTTLVEQQKGGGSPWTRRARVLLDSTVQESSEALSHPFAAISDGTVVISAQMPWMRYREPQALAVVGKTISLRFISEDLVVGEGKGIWNCAKIGLAPFAHATQTGTVESHLEMARERGLLELERGLLVRAPLDRINASGIYPRMGTTASSPVKTAYLDLMNELHDQTVRPGGQWDRAKTYGSQLWPDVQRDLWQIDNDDPYQNPGAMNYWNPSGAELLEFFRSGDPKWAWDFALPQSWLQMFSAYLNIGDQTHGNRAGFAVTSGGDGEGHWHRSAYGSDDYSYNMGMHLAYALRPNVALRDRFAQAGRTLLARYDIPRSNESERERFVSQIDITRQVIQHFEMLANCAEFVPGQTGRDCHDRLQEILLELVEDNLWAGVMCQGDIPSDTVCGQPQQFMQNALMYPFFHRMYRNYGDIGGLLENALIEGPLNLYLYGIEKQDDGTSLEVDGEWAAGMECELTADCSQIQNCVPVPDSDNNLSMYNPTKPHTVALLLMAHEVAPSIGLCEIAKEAYDDPGLTDGWQDFLGNDSGWWKGAAQMMQGMVFGVGIYDTCSAGNPTPTPTRSHDNAPTDGPDGRVDARDLLWTIESIQDGSDEERVLLDFARFWMEGARR